MRTVHHPDPSFSGRDITGAVFVDGVADLDPVEQAGLIAYFQGAGYAVDGVTLNPARTEVHVDPRDHPPVLLGTPLRDAAVDPQPGDNPPAGAGEHNPHGPEVVAGRKPRGASKDKAPTADEQGDAGNGDPPGEDQ